LTTLSTRSTGSTDSTVAIRTADGSGSSFASQPAVTTVVTCAARRVGFALDSRRARAALTALAPRTAGAYAADGARGTGPDAGRTACTGGASDTAHAASCPVCVGTGSSLTSLAAGAAAATEAALAIGSTVTRGAALAAGTSYATGVSRPTD
jgi:hypothetical protein